MGILARRKPEQPAHEPQVLQQQQPEQSLPPPEDSPAVKSAQEEIYALVERVANDEIPKDGSAVKSKLQELSQKHDIGYMDLLNDFKFTLKKVQGNKNKPALAPEVAPEPSAEVKGKADKILEQLTDCKDLSPLFREHLKSCGYIADKHLTAGLLMSHGARLLNKPSCYGATGEPGSGKSDLFEIGWGFLPAECVLRFTTCSQKAFAYLGDISHMVLILGEMNPAKRDEDDPRQELLRQLISGAEVTNVTVDRGDDNKLGKRVTFTKAEGTVVCFTSITEQHHWDSQMRSRTSWLSSDESEATTGAVMRAAAKARGATPPNKEEQEAVRLAWQQFNRTLKPLEVYIPFADDDKFIPTARHLFMRRISWLLIRYVEISALLHQHVRDKHNDGRVIATPDDYRFAHDLLIAAAPRRVKLVGEKAAKAFAEILKPALPSKGSELSKPEIIKLLKVGKSTGYNWIDDYDTAGWLEPTAETKYSRSKKYILGSDTSQPADDLGLTSPEEIEKLFVLTYSSWKTGKLSESQASTVIPLPTAKLESDWKVENSPIPTVVQNDDCKSKSAPGEGSGDLSNCPADIERDLAAYGVDGDGDEGIEI